MNPLAQTRLISLMNITRGHPDITIGVIDGPVDLHHPAFQGSKIRTVRDSQVVECKKASDIACTHGTFVTGILCAKHELPISGICPDCEIILNPIFTKEVINSKINYNNSDLPGATAEELSTAIIETIDTGAKIINLSLGLSTSSLKVYDKLQQAYDYALQKGVIIVVAAGNQGNIGNISLINHQWLIPVAACNEDGRLDPSSNFGSSIGNRGVMAPGVNIMSTYPGGQYSRMSGTSVAAPFVTGSIALLWSIFPNATPAAIMHSIRRGISFNRRRHRRSIIPPLLNVEAAWNELKNS
jgi:subtilisin family serine protease